MLKKGFTLIELLVVIAVISLLSSVILSSLQNARLKSKDALIRTEVNQFRVLLEQEFSDTGSYAALQKGWNESQSHCNLMSWGGSFTGNYSNQAKQICTRIVNNAGNSVPGNAYNFFTGNAIDQNTHFSIMAWLPGKRRWYCVSNTQSSENLGDAGTTYWNSPGCYGNP